MVKNMDAGGGEEHGTAAQEVGQRAAVLPFASQRFSSTAAAAPEDVQLFEDMIAFEEEEPMAFNLASLWQEQEELEGEEKWRVQLADHGTTAQEQDTAAVAPEDVLDEDWWAYSYPYDYYSGSEAAGAEATHGEQPGVPLQSMQHSSTMGGGEEHGTTAQEQDQRASSQRFTSTAAAVPEDFVLDDTAWEKDGPRQEQEKGEKQRRVADVEAGSVGSDRDGTMQLVLNMHVQGVAANEEEAARLCALEPSGSVQMLVQSIRGNTWMQTVWVVAMLVFAAALVLHLTLDVMELAARAPVFDADARCLRLQPVPWLKSTWYFVMYEIVVTVGALLGFCGLIACCRYLFGSFLNVLRFYRWWAWRSRTFMATAILYGCAQLATSTTSGDYITMATVFLVLKNVPALMDAVTVRPVLRRERIADWLVRGLCASVIIAFLILYLKWVVQEAGCGRVGRGSPFTTISNAVFALDTSFYTTYFAFTIGFIRLCLAKAHQPRHSMCNFDRSIHHPRPGDTKGYFRMVRV